jgi:hypothetical protein
MFIYLYLLIHIYHNTTHTNTLHSHPAARANKKHCGKQAQHIDH